MNTQAHNTEFAKVAIVTGASRGIGAAIARRLAADGIAVVVNYAGREADALRVVQSIQAAGGRAAAVRADVTVPAQVAAMFDTAVTMFGGVDILVNNAGIMQPGLVALVDTDDALLERLVDALIGGDGKATFGVVDEVIESGTDPRRFATDLLERLRDLLVLRQVPDAVESGLLDLPDGTVEVLRRQADALGDAQLSRAADLVSAGLSELKGSTAPRLQLELLCARLLLPAADDSDGGLLARLERLEHRDATNTTPAAATAAPARGPRPASPTPAIMIRA